MSDNEDTDMTVDVSAPAEKRFKYKSYTEGLREVHLPSALSGHSKLDQELEDTQSHFYEGLLHWQQLNLSPSFLSFAQKAASLSASLPLLLHNWHEVIELWLATQASSDDEGLKALLDLLQKIAQDLRSTLSPAYPELLDRLLQLSMKSISADALKALLSTFSVLFKFLLVPSTDARILEQTWTAFREAIPKCLPEIQRMLAEVWGSVLRRLKTSLREKAVVLTIKDLEGIEDAAAWCFVWACKSVSQTLHTVTPTLIAPILSYHLSCTDNGATFTLIRRVLTAFIHHVKGAEQFSPVADIIVSNFTKIFSSQNSGKSWTEEQYRLILEVAAVPASVRNGSRLTSSHLSQLYTSSMTITHPVSDTLRPAMLRFTSALLTAGEMAQWISSGRHLLAHLWNDGSSESNAKFSLELHGILAELNWGGWKAIGQLALIKRTGKLLEIEPQYTVRVVAMLCREGKLGNVDLVWRKKIGEWLEGSLAQLVQGDGKLDQDTVLELNDIIALSAYFSPEVTRLMAEAVGRYLEVEEESVREDAFPQLAWVVGACMRCLATRPSSEWAEFVDFEKWSRHCITNWSWSKSVLGGIVDLAACSKVFTPVLSLDDAYTSLKDSILSHSQSLRLCSLKLLTSHLVDVPSDTKVIIQRCLQGEEVSLDVQGVRERILRIGRVVQVVKEGDDLGADLCTRWLIGQLKVNLRPIWSPAAAALASLSQRFGDIVWKELFEELKNLSFEETPGFGDSNLSEETESENSQDSIDDPSEEERSWRDPSAHKLRSTVLRWLDKKYLLTRLRRESTIRDRLNKRVYESQLLLTFGECAPLVEKHNRDLVPYFLDLVGPLANIKLPRARLSLWLSLFSKFTNSKALHATDTLRSLYTTLLSYPDRSLQTLALDCILTYKPKSISLYENRLRLLLDDTRWRDELTALDMSSIEPQDRAEVVDVVIRLLFGSMLEKRGRSRGADRRSAVLTTLAGCTNEELGLLVDLMLRPLTAGEGLYRQSGAMIQRTSDDTLDKQLIGFLNLLGSVLKNLGSRLVKYWDALLSTTIDIVAKAQGRIDGDDSEVEIAEDDEDTVLPTSKAIRTIRQLGLKRLADFFRCPVSFDFSPYMRASFTAFISPRLPSLDKENTQAPSALMELFFVWTLNVESVHFLVEYDRRVIPKIFDCLVAVNVKPSVISRIFDIVDRLIALSADEEEISETILQPHVSLLLSNLATMIERSKGAAAVSSPLGQRQISTLSQIAQYSTNAEQASILLKLFAPLLRKPIKMVPEKVKVDLLKIVGHQMRLIPDLADSTSQVYLQTYELLSSMFQSLRSRQSRMSLVSAFQELAKIQTSLQDLIKLIEDLNAYSIKRLDEPDFERRMNAFVRLNDELYQSLSVSDWLPVLYNMMKFIQDPAELAVRSNASFAMRHFVDLVAAQTSPEHEATFSRVLFPGLKNGLRSKNEQVRAEILTVVGHAVEKCEHVGAMQDMKILLANGDEEANFFNNIHHVQLHRRSRALRRLADQCDEHPMKNSTLNEFFIPLIANYIVDTSTLDHHLVNDAINTTGRLAKHLSWNSYHALVQKYLRLSKVKDESERVYVRCLVAILDNFHFPMEDVVEDSEPTNADGEEENEVVPENTSKEPKVPTRRRIADAVNSRLLPMLLAYLESRDATTEDTTRIPIAIGVVKVALNLPRPSAQLQITKLLTTTSQIMRSKSQETRDLTRDTLSRIAVILGSEFLPLIIRELRGALLRGPHLHILATTVHHILVHVTTGDHAENFKSLDDCVADIAHVSAEVIFGESGKDVQAEGFKTKLREVRSSSTKGLDSFTITAKHITPSSISSLLAPLRSIMQETESLKIMNIVDDVLRHVANGLNSNEHVLSADLLSLCHTLMAQNSRFLQQAASRRKHLVKGDAIVQTKRQIAVHSDHFANNSFRFVVFGLDLLNTALRRNRFDFGDKSTMSRLESMVVAVGNTLYSNSSPVLMSGLKAVSGLVRCPIKSLERSLAVYIRQVLDILKQGGTTDSEVAQAALKSLAIMLRDGPAVSVKEEDLAYLLELIAPDLEEPSRQSSLFAMLRAIVSRKFVVPEIYDMMDKVSEVMVTNQSSQVQELCRSVLLQFLLDYPQGKGRLRNQMTFLAKNLSYEHESGRKSVMELLSAAVSKFQVNLVREYADLLFVALVMVIANDDSSKCREMAAQLIKSLVERLDTERRNTLMSHLHVWSAQREQLQLQRVSAQVYGIVVDALQSDISSYAPSILEDARSCLESSSQQLESLDEDSSMDVDIDWQTPYYSLTVLAKLAKVLPDLITRSEGIDWRLTVNHLLFPHAWVRAASSRLLGTLFGAAPLEDDISSDTFSPFSQSGMKEITQKLCQQLKSEHLDEALSLQTVKNLFYVGKCYAGIPFEHGEQDQGQGDEDDDEDKQTHPLPWLFSKLSYQVRSALIAKRNHPSGHPNWFNQPLSVLRWFAAMTSHLEPNVLERFLVHILSPLHRIVEEDTIRDPKMAEVKDTAVELQDLVQSKVGTTKFSAIYNQIRQSIVNVRRERKESRVLQIATNPEAAANRKAHRNAIKKESRKRKGLAFADGRGQIKRRREE